ncbi:MAG: peptidylprolyl isomerase [Pirellulales bacterium]|nr:peptidylprolyl isomerase [Pirellulales bacterium]
MHFRLLRTVIALLLFVPTVVAETVRFDTNVGTFDMELNPTGNPNLQGHVDNMLKYVTSGSYDRTVINRNNEVSAEGTPDFVLQMGGFQLPGFELPAAFSDFPPITAFDPVVTDLNGDGLIDFDTTGLTNERGTVSLALSSTGANSGTSSFFINLDDIPSLDPGGSIGEFVPFARVLDFATVDLIRSLQTASLSGGGVGSSNIPILDDNQLVFIERAFVLDPVPEAAAAVAAFLPGGGFQPTPPVASVTLASIPEPSSLMIAVGVLLFIAAVTRRKIAY